MTMKIKGLKNIVDFDKPGYILNMLVNVEGSTNTVGFDMLERILHN
jgi:hypothetical protein